MNEAERFGGVRLRGGVASASILKARVGEEVLVPVGTQEVRIYVTIPGVVYLSVNEGRGWGPYSRTGFEAVSEDEPGFCGILFEKLNQNQSYRVRSSYG